MIAIRVVGRNRAGREVWSAKCDCGLGCLIAEDMVGQVKSCAGNKGDNTLYFPPEAAAAENPYCFGKGIDEDGRRKNVLGCECRQIYFEKI